MYKRFIKKIIDILLVIIGMPLFIVTFIIVAPMVYIEDKGPIFYNSMRLGKNGVPFKMYKFRSMKMNAPDLRNADGSTYNSSDDQRMTRVGRFLRESSLDEVPQLLNVLKGDMSIIGPRPDLSDAMNVYSEEHILKLSVKPGITGYNQAYFRNMVIMSERFDNDVRYVKNMSFLFDLRIFMKTVTSVLKSNNVYIEESMEYDIGDRSSTNSVVRKKP